MRYLYTLLCLAITLGSQAQAPEGFSYQAVVRNTDNTLVTNTSIGVRISILQGSITGVMSYMETHTPTTNSNGLFTIVIGEGTLVSGDFGGIDWSNGPYFIKTETDPAGGTNYTITGTSQLLSVPYALHAKTADQLTTPITENDPVFESSPAYGITSGDITSWENKLDEELDDDPTNEIQDLELNGNELKITNNADATSIDLSPFANNTALRSIHNGTIQSIPYQNGLFTLINNMVDSIKVDNTSEKHLILGTVRVFGGSLNGSNSSVGGYFLVLQRDTDLSFASPENLTYVGGICYLETPNNTVSANLGFGDGPSLHYVEKDLSPGTYYYRLAFYPNGVGINAGTFDIYQRDFSILSIK